MNLPVPRSSTPTMGYNWRKNLSANQPPSPVLCSVSAVPVCVFGYRELTGHWPDFTNQEDLEKVGAEAFAFVNFARFAVPLRIGLALSTTPWIQENIVDKYMKKDDGKQEEPVDEDESSS